LRKGRETERGTRRKGGVEEGKGERRRRGGEEERERKGMRLS